MQTYNNLNPLAFLAVRVGLIDDVTFRALQALARFSRRDFYSFVAAYVLSIDYYEVMLQERFAVKEGLFVRMYSAPILPRIAALTGR